MAFQSVWLGHTYATHPWAFFARNARGANADFTLVNYATFYFNAPGIGLMQATQSSNVYHSEKHVWLTMRVFGSFNRMAIPSWVIGQSPLPIGTLRLNPAGVQALDGSVIFAVYTEREPCPSCSPFLTDILPNGTIVGWHFAYPGEETKKHKHDDDAIARHALMAISRGKTYDQTMKEDSKEFRKQGNQGLRGALKGIQSQYLTARSAFLVESDDAMMVDSSD